jgi:hypothetical protein
MIHILSGASSMAGRVCVACLLGAQINRQSVYTFRGLIDCAAGLPVSRLWKAENLIRPSLEQKE